MSNSDFICDTCGMQFLLKSEIIKHFKRFHSHKKFKCRICKAAFTCHNDLGNHKKSHQKSENLDCCRLCNTIFTNKANLVRHLKKKHPDLSQPEKMFKHNCTQCHRKFNHLFNFKFHMRKVHNAVIQEPLKHKCSLCPQLLPASMKSIMDHFITSHNININKTEMVFNNLKHFKTWKEDIEKETNSRFVVFAKKDSRTEYRCHRSGHFVSKSKGIRKLKSKGTRKINGICPSSIILNKRDDKFNVTFVNTHVGHDNDIKHLWLSERERLTIASKIANNVPFNTIINDLKSNTNSARANLLTKKDLYNIQAMYGLKKTEDEDVDSWVINIASHSTSCVLFYKKVGILNHYRDLNSKHFTLMIMNDIQSDILLKNHRVICLDRSYCLNKLGYELITLYSVSEVPFPCLFIVTNKTDKNDLIFYFNLLKEHIGLLKPQIIASDMDNTIYEAWCQIFGEPTSNVCSPWHVDWLIRKNLIKIKNRQQQCQVYNLISNIIVDDEKSYDDKLNLILNHLDNGDFKDFFIHNFIISDIKWTDWQREKIGFTNNSNLTQIHSDIKYIYLNKKNIKYVDKSINNIMKYVRDNYSYDYKENHEDRVKDSVLKHAEAESVFNGARIMEHENSYLVDFPGIPNCEIHKVVEVDKEHSCSVSCSKCNACLHQYSCSCTDSALLWNMCKHIHLVCLYLSNIKNTMNSNVIYYDLLQSDNLSNIDLSNVINCDKSIDEFENQTNGDEVGLDSLIETLDRRKTALSSKILNLLEYVESVESVEMVDAVEKLLLPMETTLETFKQLS